MKKNKPKRIVRKFTLDPCQGAAAAFSGSTVEGLPLKSIIRKGNNVTLIYQK